VVDTNKNFGHGPYYGFCLDGHLSCTPTDTDIGNPMSAKIPDMWRGKTMGSIKPSRKPKTTQEAFEDLHDAIDDLKNVVIKELLDFYGVLWNLTGQAMQILRGDK